MTGKYEIQLVQVFDKKDALLMMYPCVDQFTSDTENYESMVLNYRCAAVLLRHPEYTKDDLKVILTYRDFSDKVIIDNG